jgi:hypothetical protein
MNQPIPAALKQAYKNKKLLPIIGAGVSMSIKNRENKRIFPSWRELLELAAERLRKENCDIDADAVTTMLAKQNYQLAADFAREGLTGNLWNRFFKELFLINLSGVSTDSLRLPRAVWGLSNRLITLNYDRVLSLTCPTQDSLIVLDNTNGGELADFVRGEALDPTIWHLHGRVDNLKTIIFTSESYNKLYIEKDSDYKAALNVFQSLSRDEHLVFVGCSLDDAELMVQISEQHKLFDQNTGPHYALVHSKEVDKVRAKLKDLPVQIISFEEFGAPLLELITSISDVESEVLSGLPQVIKEKKAESKDLMIKEHPRLAVLIADPLDKKYDYDDWLREIKKIRGDVTYLHLSMKVLNELENFDYALILSSISRGKLVIEDDFLVSRRIPLQDLEDNIFCADTVKGIFILTDQMDLDELDLQGRETISLPTLILPKLEKEKISNVIFKIFRGGKLPALDAGMVINEEKFSFREFKTERQESWLKSPLSRNIDAKSTRNYIGRSTDVQNICKSIIGLRLDSEILCIKGSGGIGKTITVKKIAIEFSDRNFFRDGIKFIDCEFLASYEAVLSSVALSFDLERSQDLLQQIANELKSKEILIILDNVETLLYIEDSDEVKDFFGFLCDHAAVVVTSRERLNLPYEQIYELRHFTTDEALELFVAELPEKQVRPDEISFLRSEIIENLLDNNPLAIKLITKNIPKGKSFKKLKMELEQDFFGQVDDYDLSAFDSASDSNIERKRSLYASINFSYQHLSEKEKMAFEILSLFPAGINLENLKRISSGERSAPSNNGKLRLELPRDSLITDSIIRSLDNKSMVQISNNLIQLQSIVGKFSEHKFKSRDQEKITRFYQNAFEYNIAFARWLYTMSYENPFFVGRVFNEHQLNFIKSLGYLNSEIVNSERLVDYVDDLESLFNLICANSSFVQALNDSADLRLTDEHEMRCLNIIKLSARYFGGDFDAAFQELQKVAPQELLVELPFARQIDNTAINTAMTIYCMEGEALAAARDYVRRRFLPVRYPSSFFFIGEFDLSVLESCIPHFVSLETQFALNILTVDIIDKYLDSIYEKGHLERMQCSYLKAKLGGMTLPGVKKLIAVNPYASGLKKLMLAFLEKNIDKKTWLFEQSLNELVHIKYYYTEALFYYAEHLKSIDDGEGFISILGRGIEFATRHHYRFLLHKLRCLGGLSSGEYLAENYPWDEDYGFEDYLKLVAKTNRKK